MNFNDLRQFIVELLTTVESSNSEISNKEAVIEELKRENVFLKQKCVVTEDQKQQNFECNRQDIFENDQQEKLKLMQTETAKLNVSLNKLHTESNDYREKVNSFTIFIHEVENKMSKAVQEIKAHQFQLDTLKKTIEEMKEQEDDIKNVVNQHQEYRIINATKLNLLEEKCDGLAVVIEQLEIDNQELKSENQDLKEKSSNLSVKMLVEPEKLKSQLQKTDEELSKKDDMIELLKSELSSSRLESSSIREQLEKVLAGQEAYTDLICELEMKLGNINMDETVILEEVKTQ